MPVANLAMIVCAAAAAAAAAASAAAAAATAAAVSVCVVLIVGDTSRPSIAVSIRLSSLLIAALLLPTQR
jgi:hypothetical protein